MQTRQLIAGAAFLGALAVPGIAAAAANAYTTGNVNLRAGPSTNFPRVTTLPVGVTVTIHGCLRGWSWCDTSWRGSRGWVSGRYLESLYRGRRVLVPTYAARIGLPIITFQFGNYWDNYYSDRAWYRDRPRWRHRWSSGDWNYQYEEGAARSHRRQQEVDQGNDQGQQPGRTQTSNTQNQDEPIRTELRRKRQPNLEQETEQGVSEEVPPGIQKRGDKACPPGLLKQGRCIPPE